MTKNNLKKNSSASMLGYDQYDLYTRTYDCKFMIKYDLHRWMMIVTWLQIWNHHHYNSYYQDSIIINNCSNLINIYQCTCNCVYLIAPVLTNNNFYLKSCCVYSKLTSRSSCTLSVHRRPWQFYVHVHP